MFDITALGELLIDFIPAGNSAAGNMLFEFCKCSWSQFNRKERCNPVSTLFGIWLTLQDNQKSGKYCLIKVNIIYFFLK